VFFLVFFFFFFFLFWCVWLGVSTGGLATVGVVGLAAIEKKKKSGIAVLPCDRAFPDNVAHAAVCGRTVWLAVFPQRRRSPSAQWGYLCGL